jgi:hypothetical protein
MAPKGPPKYDVDVDVEAAEPSETTALIGKASSERTKQNSNHDEVVAELIVKMFMAQFKYSDDISRNPKTNPKLPPVVRFKRHRNFYIFEINQFRHWWKTSR